LLTADRSDGWALVLGGLIIRRESMCARVRQRAGYDPGPEMRAGGMRGVNFCVVPGRDFSVFAGARGALIVTLVESVECLKW
jgi:hypothetical protein